MDSNKNILYNFYDINNVCLFSAMSLCILNFSSGRSKLYTWLDEIHHIDLQRFESKDGLRIAKNEFIKNENPKYNKQNNHERGNASLRKSTKNREEIDKDILTSKEAAKYLGRSEITLRQWRQLNKSPKYIKNGRHIKYRKSELNKFLESK